MKRKEKSPSIFGTWVAPVRSALAVVVLIITSQFAAAETTLERLKSDGFVRIGFSNFSPTSFVGPDSTMTGASPELAKAFFADLGVETVDGVVADFGSLIGGLQAGRFDMIAVAMQIQPKRCEKIAFGDPEFQYTQSFVTASGNPLNLDSFAAVAANPAARIGLLSGAGQIRYAEIAGVGEGQQVLFPDFLKALAGLQAGRVDAVAGASVTLNSLVAKMQDPGLEFVSLSEQPSDETGKPVLAFAGMGFRQDDDNLRNAWNEWRAEARDSGELLQIIEEFGFTEHDVPAKTVTAQAICDGTLQ